MSRLTAIVLVPAVLLGCANPAPASLPPPASAAVSPAAISPSPRPSPSPLTVPSPSPAPGPTAPPELLGTWRTVLDVPPGAQALPADVELRIRESRYGITRGAGAATGQLSVEGDRITFRGSNLCEGTGTYSWSLENGEITFTAVGTDPCGGRADVLDGITYTKAEP